jgi:hypothetical protein
MAYGSVMPSKGAVGKFHALRSPVTKGCRICPARILPLTQIDACGLGTWKLRFVVGRFALIALAVLLQGLAKPLEEGCHQRKLISVVAVGPSS